MAGCVYGRTVEFGFEPDSEAIVVPRGCACKAAGPDGLPDTGAIRDDKKTTDYTQWTDIADLKNRRYYVKTYDNQRLQGIDLMAFDLDAKGIMSAAVAPGIEIPALFSK